MTLILGVPNATWNILLAKYFSHEGIASVFLNWDRIMMMNDDDDNWFSHVYVKLCDFVLTFNYYDA